MYKAWFLFFLFCKHAAMLFGVGGNVENKLLTCEGDHAKPGRKKREKRKKEGEKKEGERENRFSLQGLFRIEFDAKKMKYTLTL